ncbi:unnamed protein product [Penicillium salamii]|nr:unnamed protein product [Penicillium salamii]CAG8875721.1 unnamed protein product [Penicillium salamii]
MANDPKPSRSAERIAAKAKSRAGRSRAGSPCSVRSTGSTSKADRSLLSSVAKLRKELGHSVTKSTRHKEDEATHRECLHMMDQIQEEFELALGAIADERAHHSQSIQRLHDEKAQEISKLQQAITTKDKALVEKQRLERELCQIQQQQESVNATMQDQISWHDIQPVLHQAHGELTSATTRFWNTIESLHNHRVASYLPGSGVIHGTWPDQNSPLVSLGHDALPGFSASSDYLLDTQQAPESTNQYASLV